MILKYMKGFKHCGIIYDSQKRSIVEEYSDLDWVGDLES